MALSEWIKLSHNSEAAMTSRLPPIYTLHVENCSSLASYKTLLYDTVMAASQACWKCQEWPVTYCVSIDSLCFVNIAFII